MTKLIFIITMFSCSAVFGQQQKSNKTPSKVTKTKRVSIPPPSMITISKIEPETKNCFLFRQEKPIDTLVYVTETLLEYGWIADNARMVISSSNYDPIKKQEAEKQGMRLMLSETIQYIDGTFKIVKGVLTFTPKKTEGSENKNFRLFLKPKTQNIDYLKDENGNKYNKGKCNEPSIGAG